MIPRRDDSAITSAVVTVGDVGIDIDDWFAISVVTVELLNGEDGCVIQVALVAKSNSVSDAMP